ncbi:MAG: tRNA (adenosine(37)-N6)-dimethylallyltransferase MiaA [Actinomycetota bacterium]|nr:tRNA (adenosine(37)-N6)-dimethylallyltransferase MiaA [Actinomycetota bacterium]
MAPRVAALVGPTAAGKTRASLSLAPLIGAEIVSLDSMQVYRGMDVGTAKPTVAMRAAVPHHLLDLFEPSHELSVAEFQSLGRSAIGEVTARGNRPLLVGGSGLYVRSVVDDLRFPPHSPEVRRGLDTEIEQQGTQALYARLIELDPTAAQRIEPGNSRRIVRALEVIEVTGRPFSENYSWERFESLYDLSIAGITLPRDQLYAGIEKRVDAMLKDGLLEEVRRLEAAGMGRTSRHALGYRQVLDAAPGTSVQQIRDEIVAATKRFARRQESWFRADPRVVWFDAADRALIERLAGFFDRLPARPSR